MNLQRMDIGIQSPAEAQYESACADFEEQIKSGHEGKKPKQRSAADIGHSALVCPAVSANKIQTNVPLNSENQGSSSQYFTANQ